MAAYAILDADNLCINRVEWDGVSLYNLPEGYRAVLDPNGIFQRETSVESENE
jgi:hypothetical protein